jgi:benzoyl-CoA reductase/2-hydroxyglutaryl-CoA dehydratase subunit BcrC/BadD/HgdB
MKIDAIDEKYLIASQDLFVRIRFFALERNSDELSLCLSQIDEKQAFAEHFCDGFQRDILLYCFEILKNFISNQKYEIMGDFADAIHNLPEIFSKEYNSKKYWKIYIKPFVKKYGGEYFKSFKPNFLSGQ